MLRRFIHRSLIFEKRCWERNGFFDTFIMEWHRGKQIKRKTPVKKVKISIDSRSSEEWVKMRAKIATHKRINHLRRTEIQRIRNTREEGGQSHPCNHTLLSQSNEFCVLIFIIRYLIYLWRGEIKYLIICTLVLSSPSSFVFRAGYIIFHNHKSLRFSTLWFLFRLTRTH